MLGTNQPPMEFRPGSALSLVKAFEVRVGAFGGKASPEAESFLLH